MPLTLTIDDLGMFRVVETGELREAVKLLIFAVTHGDTATRLVGIDYDDFYPCQMHIEPHASTSARYDALRGCIATFATVRLMGTYVLRVEDAHPMTAEEREHLSGVIDLINRSVAAARNWARL
jgi:hypothetical protein